MGVKGVRSVTGVGTAAAGEPARTRAVTPASYVTRARPAPRGARAGERGAARHFSVISGGVLNLEPDLPRVASYAFL